MKNHFKLITAVSAVILFTVFGCAGAYGQYYMSGNRMYAANAQHQSATGQTPVYYTTPRYNIDFLSADEAGRRFAIAVHPLLIFNKGLRVDFEFELNKPGNWLQVGLSGYYSQLYDNGYDSGYGWRSGWSTFNSGFDDFQKLKGAGLSLAYKSMISRNGYYVSCGAKLIYYDVHHYAQGLFEYVENGNTLYMEDYRIVNTEFYRPTAFANLGRTFAFQTGIIIDFYGGIGYTHSIYDPNTANRFNSSWMSFGYRGFHLTGGMRIGVVWPNRARENNM